jgi:hypothetical protein
MDPPFPFAPIREDFCALGFGDCGSKSSSKSTIDTETLNKSVSNFLSSQASSATASATNLNDMKIHIDKLSGGCDIDASQHINSSVKALASIDSVSTKDLQDTIKNSANAQIDQAAAAKTGFFATGSASASTVSDYKNKVSNIIEKNITDQKKADAFASVYNKNNNELNIGECGDGPFALSSAKLNASQNIQSDLVAQAIVKSISNDLQKLDATNTTDTSVKQTTDTKTGGLEDVIASIFSGLQGIYGIVAIVCICICLAVLAFALSPAGQKATTNASGAAVKKLG